MKSSDTIYALASGLGRAGVAVIRVSGPQAGPAVKKLCGDLPVPRRASLRKIVSTTTGALIDRGLVLWFPRPFSFTGEDMAEFHVHGGPAIVRAMFDEFAAMQDFRAAEAGEFTRRAFRNDKFDLMEVEGLADLIEARTELQRRQAILHAGGSSSAILEAWRFKLIQILARLEAAIDFVDETHVGESALEGCQAKLEALADEIEAEVERGRQGERLREGVRIVVAGLPNVGKSSLLNRLAGKDAAIVSSLPGTTRDVVEAHLNLRGIPVILQDTAGLRAAPGDAVETEGITRAGAAMRRADLVLWIMSGDVPDSWRPPTLDSEALWIWNKSDLVLPSTVDITAGPYLTVSCHTGEGFEGLQKTIAERLEALVAGGEAAVVTRQRHRDSLTATITHLRAAAKGEQPFEIITEEVRLAGQEIGRLTGFVDVEGLLDEIFAEFCIGK